MWFLFKMFFYNVFGIFIRNVIFSHCYLGVKTIKLLPLLTFYKTWDCGIQPFATNNKIRQNVLFYYTYVHESRFCLPIMSFNTYLLFLNK